jgi:hypothetical protein
MTNRRILLSSAVLVLSLSACGKSALDQAAFKLPAHGLPLATGTSRRDAGIIDADLACRLADIPGAMERALSAAQAAAKQDPKWSALRDAMVRTDPPSASAPDELLGGSGVMSWCQQAQREEHALGLPDYLRG